MSEITYDLATIDEVPEFHKFFAYTINELFGDYSKETQEYFLSKDYDEWWMTKSIKEGSKILYLAKVNNSIVGYIFFGKIYGGVSMASWIAVSPDYQKKGIAAELLNLWEQWVINNKGHALQIWTQDKNIEYYQKRGFTHSGQFPSAWFGMTTNLLYKTLKSVEAKTYKPE
ncbi:GNAT family N-acetyltransferase [Candidatus Woesebacteria bacterium]|nr:GNAT family N-acetyltransferase [Candidatus Woesebacteria bacterium]